MADFTNLGKFLKQKRQVADISQGVLAEKLGGLHPQFVSNWERGLCAPPSHCIDTLISVLRINREDMVEVMVQDARSGIEMKILKKRASRKVQNSRR